MPSRRYVLATLFGLPRLLCLAQGTQRTSTIPARIDEQDRFLIRVQIESQPLWCHVDTGGGAQIYVSHKRAAEMGIQPTFEGRSAGPSEGSLRRDSRARVSLEVGGAVLPQQTLVIKDRFFDDVAVIGAKVFESAIIEFDYKLATLTFHPRACFQYEGPGAAIPFDLWSNNPHVVAHLTLRTGDRIPIRMTVDTGARGSAAYITPAFDERLRRLDRVLGWQRGARGLMSCRVERLAVGRFTMDDAEIHLLPSQGFGGSPDAPEGLLGTGFLRRYRFFLDYAKRQMILKPQARGELL